jgi:CBS domain-containing protein
MPETVSEVMTRDPIAVEPQTPLEDAIRAIAQNRVSGLPVVENGQLVGVLSESDLMWQETGVDPPPYIMLLDSVIYLRNPARYRQQIHKALGQTVEEVMSRNPIAVGPDRPLREAARLMHDKSIRRLPVVDGDHRPIGILTRGDIVRALAAE